MQPFIADYLERLAAQHAALKAALDGLGPDALDWVPGPGMNAIAVLIVHLAGAERYWIGDVALQDPSGRVRAREFEARAHSVETLTAHLDRSLAYARSGLADASLEMLAAPRRSVNHPDRPFTVGWALLHALEHTAEHVGHIQLTRQLWDARR